MEGSSPRVRGEVRPFSVHKLHAGIIPAGAGRRAGQPGPPRGGRDHPRGCGEKLYHGRGRQRQAGSSPRVRGEGFNVFLGADDAGIIPAGAGRRLEEGTACYGGWDHPRGCGEKVATVAPEVTGVGSSPRVRGEGGDGGAGGDGGGIIPAGAGRSSFFWQRSRKIRDHPRGCGEKHVKTGTPIAAKGSSPRVRGEVVAVGVGIAVLGIIPAGAGRRPLPYYRWKQNRDHPRGCGEKLPLRLSWMLNLGSSPRVRGEG